MNEQRFGRRPRAIAIILALLLAAIVGVLAYNAGVAHGVAVGAAVQQGVERGAEQGVQQGSAPAAGLRHHGPWAYGGPWGYGYGWHPWGFGFGFFPIFPLIGLFFFVLLLKGLFWGGPWRGGWAYGGPPPHLQDRFDDWHRRAHERMNAQPSASGPASAADGPNVPPAPTA